MMGHVAKTSPRPFAAVYGPYRHENAHLIELRQVVKKYQSAAGSFTALAGIDVQVDRASSWPSLASRAAASPR